MAKKAKTNSINPIAGWFLLAREELDYGEYGDWYIAWELPFSTRADALSFARGNKWPAPFRAVRGQITVKP